MNLTTVRTQYVVVRPPPRHNWDKEWDKGAQSPLSHFFQLPE